MNADLFEGMTDGVQKKNRPDTAAVAGDDRANKEARHLLLPGNGFSWGGDANGMADGSHP